MSGYFAKSDVYDKNGILLISKGRKLTNRIISTLLKRGSYKLSELVDANDNKKNDPLSLSKGFGSRKNFPKNHTLNQSSKILSSIIFESRTKPWWIYVNALGNYLNWLYTHSIDVAMISLMMAMELGYEDEELWNIGLGSLLHDVGKLLVPKPILEKTEPLTDLEESFIRQHCELGESSLEGFNLPKEYTNIVLQHHERLDGSGYPKGLKGDEICPSAKIVMIADVVDEITAFHPYRQSQSMDAAIKKLRSEERRYPQELVDLLESILNK